ncbi:MAG TPA: hypothetical protein VK977_00515 [Actinomycetota bacterium]|nr:hypothetical protein [Actinomycetota bacterium]
MLRRSKIALVVGILATLALSACGGAGGSRGGGTVSVTLQEWAVIPAQNSVGAGSVTFDVTNDGPEHPHELVVIATDLAPDALPTTHEGAVDEDGEGIEVIGEIEEFDPGEAQSATFDLSPGSYVLVCNVAGEEGGEHGGEIHYKMGMFTAFTVQ